MLKEEDAKVFKVKFFRKYKTELINEKFLGITCGIERIQKWSNGFKRMLLKILFRDRNLIYWIMCLLRKKSRSPR